MSLNALASVVRLAQGLHIRSIVMSDGDTMIEKRKPYLRDFGLSVRTATALSTWGLLVVVGNCLKLWRSLHG